MKEHDITPDMKVSDLIQQHPETVDVFLRHGCPDMRNGIFAMSAHVMKIRWAAKIHKIPLNELMTELNLAIHPEEDEGTIQ